MVKRYLILLGLLLCAAPARAQFATIRCWNGTTAFACGDLVSSSLRVKLIEAPTLTINGTVTANQGGSWTVTANAGSNLNTSALATTAKQDTLIGHVDGLEGLLGGTLTVGTHAVTQSGTWTVTGAGGTFPVTATNLDVQIGGSDTLTVAGTVTANAGTNLNTSSLLTTSSHDAAFGTAGTADAQVRTIQGIASMTPVQVSQATAANLNATITDGSGALTVDGTVTANIGTSGSLALEAGGNLAAAATSLGTLDNTVAGNELQVDIVSAPTLTVNSHAVTNAGTFATQIVEGGVTADVLNLTGNKPLAVAIVDSDGNQIDEFGGGGGGELTPNTEYTEGDTDATIAGIAAMWEDAGNTLTPVSASKPLPVDPGTVTVTDGSGALNVIVDSGSVSVGDGSGALTVDGTVTVTDGSGALNVIVDSGAINATVSDGAGALNTIVDSGSITANAGTNLNTSALALEGGGNLAAAATSLGTLDNAIAGSEMQVDVVAALPAGNNNIGDVDVASSVLPSGAASSANQTTVIGHLDGVEGLLTTIDADTGNMATSLGLLDNVATRGSYISAGSTEDEHAVKASAGTLWSITATNVAATVAFLKCEDDTAANTAPGTDTPEFRAAIPGATTGGGFHVSFPKGLAFANAWTCWIVEGAADADVAEVGANEVMLTYTFE